MDLKTSIQSLIPHIVHATRWLVLIAAPIVLLVLLVSPRAKFPGVEFIDPVTLTVADARAIGFSPEITATVHDKVALVLVNNTTLAESNIPSMLQARGLLAKIISRVDAAGPKAIGIDFYFLKNNDPDKTRLLMAAIKKARAPIVLGAAERPIDITPVERDYQIAFIAESGRKSGFLNLSKNRTDEIVRYHPRGEPGSPTADSFAFALAKAAGVDAQSPAGRSISWLRPKRDGFAAFIPQNGDLRRPFVEIAAHELLAAAAVPASGPSTARSAFTSNDLKGRVVIIGSDLRRQDKHKTPFTIVTGERVPGAVIHAHMLSELLDGPSRFITEASDGVARVLFIAVFAAGLAVGWYLASSLLRGFMEWTFGLIIFVVADWFVLSYAHTTLPVARMALLWFLAVTAGSALRYVVMTSPEEAGR